MIKPTIFLHIGMPKTATTSLQEYFYLNTKVMASRYKLHYAKSAGTKNHLKMAAYAAPENTRDLLDAVMANSNSARETFFKKFRSEAIAVINKGGHLLVSNEHMASRVSEPETLKALKLLTEGLGAKVKIIIYLRRQDKYMFSSYSTWIKSGGSGKFKSDRYRQKKFDYTALLEKWAKVFGKENLIVRPFEKSRWRGGTIYADFMSIFGIDNLSQFQDIPVSANASLDRAQLVFLAKFNKNVAAFEGDKRNELRGDIVELLEGMSTTDKIQLSKEEVGNIIDYFRKDNDFISKEYMNGEQLFSEELPDIDDNYTPKLTVDRAVEISAFLWQHQQGLLNKKSIRKIFS